MANIDQIIHKDQLFDAIILSAAVYAKNPKQELQKLSRDYDLPAAAQYSFLPDHEIHDAGLSTCKQILLVVKSLTSGHYIVACRGTRDVGDALVDLKILKRTLSLGDGAAHAGFLDRAKTVPLHYLKKLLVQNEKIVFTGHSLGGAVASLLTLRLLESTGKWCHDQIHCYTFGCPFFADYQLANYINSNYKQHFVHLVSGCDLVPKAIPIVYTLYSLWGGLHAGPLADLLNCSSVFMLGLKALNMNQRFCRQIQLLGTASEALGWLPTLSRLALHRLLALAISFHSGYGYAFAGQLLLLNTGSSMFHVESREKWTLITFLRFHFSGVSLESIKKHRLRSYLAHIFELQGEEVWTHKLAKVQASDSASATYSGVTTHTTTFDIQGVDKNLSMAGYDDILPHSSQVEEPLRMGKMKGVRAFRCQVACIIFTKRLQKLVPTKKKRNLDAHSSFLRQRISRFSHIIRHLGKFYLGYSALCSLCQIRRLICKI